MSSLGDALAAGDGLTVRPAGPADEDQVVQVMTLSRAHFVGARHPSLFRAIARDAQCDPPLMELTVAELEGELVGFIAVCLGDSRRYWLTMSYRHPRAALAIVAHRFRKSFTRFRYRRRYIQEYSSDEVLVPEVELPEAVAERLNRRPPASGSPRPGEHGPLIAEGLFMGILPAARGRRVGVRLFRELFDALRAKGMERYDCSFSRENPAAIRMHCNFPFTVYRLPGGYWGSLRLADLDAADASDAIDAG